MNWPPIEWFCGPAEKVYVVPGGACIEEFAGVLDRTALAAVKNRLGLK